MCAYVICVYSSGVQTSCNAGRARRLDCSIDRYLRSLSFPSVAVDCPIVIVHIDQAFYISTMGEVTTSAVFCFADRLQRSISLSCHSTWNFLLTLFVSFFFVQDYSVAFAR